MKTCKKCKKDFAQYVIIDGKRRNLGSRKFCLECSPFGQRNRRDLEKHNDEYKYCVRCKEMKPIREFYRKGTNLSTYCTVCTREYNRHRTQINKLKAVEYLGGQCIICGYNTCYDALDFHHKDPSKKDFTISKGKDKSWDSIIEELDKCVLLCSNCHRELHSTACSFSLM